MKPAAVAGKMSWLCMSCTRTQIGPSSFVSSFQQLRTRKYSTAYTIGINRTDATRFDSCKIKRYSSTWNSQKPSDLDNMTPIDREKALFKIKRRMGAAHSKGQYDVALEAALELEEKVALVMGKRNGIYASCLNNIALMHKLLGNKDEALSNYIASLHVYEDVSGKQSPSYISTLANLGMLYKIIAEASSGVEKEDHLVKAEEALKEAFDLRTTLTGNNSKETLTSANHLSTLWRVAGKAGKAEKLLGDTLGRCRSTLGNMDVLTATTLNNLGVLLKNEKRLYEAHHSYSEALEIRSTLLGDKHVDTIVTMYNLSELLLVMGSDDDIARATALQKEILANGEGSTPNNTNSSATAAAATTATASSGEKKGETLIFTESSIIARQSLSVGRELEGEGKGGGGEKIEVGSVVDEEAVKKAEARKRLKENAPELPVQVTYATRPKKGKKAV